MGFSSNGKIWKSCICQSSSYSSGKVSAKVCLNEGRTRVQNALRRQLTRQETEGDIGTILRFFSVLKSFITGGRKKKENEWCTTEKYKRGNREGKREGNAWGERIGPSEKENRVNVKQLKTSRKRWRKKENETNG